MTDLPAGPREQITLNWRGEGIHLPAEQILEVLKGVGRYAVTEFGFQIVEPRILKREDFNIEEVMADKFNAISPLIRRLIPQANPTLTPEEAVVMTLIRDDMPMPINIGFARYPEIGVLFDDNGKSREIETKLGEGFYIDGRVLTAFAIEHGEDALVGSHQASLEVIEKLGNRFHKFNVIDHTGYQRHQDPERLIATVNNRFAMDALKVGEYIEKNPDADRKALGREYPVLQLRKFEHFEMQGELLKMANDRKHLEKGHFPPDG